MIDPDHELIRARLDKLQRLRESGKDPYPHRFDRTHTCSQAISAFEAAEQRDGDGARTESITAAGRLVAFRGMGRATFGDLLDGSGRMQIMFRQNVLGDEYEVLRDLDMGAAPATGRYRRSLPAGATRLTEPRNLELRYASGGLDVDFVADLVA